MSRPRRSFIVSLFMVVALAVIFASPIKLQAERNNPEELSRAYLKDLVEETRFYRDASGAITDRKTGLQWLEGPDEPTSWQMAQTWINKLGGDWRTPTTSELAELYIADSRRKGIYGDPLCLDEAFKMPGGYCFWSTIRVSDTAWIYDFSRGYAHWIDIYFPGRFDRAVTVRNKP